MYVIAVASQMGFYRRCMPTTLDKCITENAECIYDRIFYMGRCACWQGAKKQRKRYIGCDNEKRERKCAIAAYNGNEAARTLQPTANDDDDDKKKRKKIMVKRRLLSYYAHDVHYSDFTICGLKMHPRSRRIEPTEKHEGGTAATAAVVIVVAVVSTNIFFLSSVNFRCVTFSMCLKHR